jgi:hypothetical protein
MRTKHTAIPTYYPDCPHCLQLLRLLLLNERFRSYRGNCAVCSLVVKCSWKCAQLKTTSQISGRGEGQSPLESTVNMYGNSRENLHHTNAVTSAQAHMKACAFMLQSLPYKSHSQSSRPITFMCTPDTSMRRNSLLWRVSTNSRLENSCAKAALVLASDEKCC